MLLQTRGLTAGTGQTGPQIPPDVRGRVEETGRAAVTGMGSLHDPRARFVMFTSVLNTMKHATAVTLVNTTEYYNKVQ